MTIRIGNLHLFYVSRRERMLTVNEGGRGLTLSIFWRPEIQGVRLYCAGRVAEWYR